MTDAEYFKNVIELQKERYHPGTNTGCTNVITTRLERAIKDLDRLAAIDAVLALRVNTETWGNKGVVTRRMEEQGGLVLSDLAAQNLLPPSKEVADE